METPDFPSTRDSVSGFMELDTSETASLSAREGRSGWGTRSDSVPVSALLGAGGVGRRSGASISIRSSSLGASVSWATAMELPKDVSTIAERTAAKKSCVWIEKNLHDTS